MALTIVFMGTPAFAAPTLAALAEAGHRIVAVYTQPPRPGGRRGLAPVKSPVHQQAELLGFPVRTPTTLRQADAQEAFGALGADVAVVVAYGLILPPAILAGTRLGAYNAHASLLPRWRGAAPIQRAVMAGDEETGVTIMKMDEGLDTGPMALTRRVAIGPDMTAGELHDILMTQSGTLMAEAMRRLERGDLPLTAQPDAGASYAAKIDKAETRIDFSRPATEVHDHIRGLAPRPGAWFALGGSADPATSGAERVKVLGSTLETGMETGGAAPGTVLDEALAVACGEGAVRLTRLQRAGGKPLAAGAFLRGTALPAGAVIGALVGTGNG